MSGLDILNKAILLLGYNQATFSDNKSDFNIRALDVINNICIDLGLTTIDSLTSIITADKRKFDALTTGVAMLLSLLEGDTNKNIIFTGLYNAKRAICLKTSSVVEDVMPYDDGGV
ncbi:MAG: hypothetical protein IJP22_01135 [Clostridia bacterium]|nr:hypothetical protein [Clostridia bacterium]